MGSSQRFAGGSGGFPVVLVAEDDATTRQLFALTLEANGMRVLEAADGDAALALLAAHEVDVVLLDRHMPGRDGPATLEAIRADPRTAATSVIFVTGSLELQDRLQGLDAGADDHLEKPIAPVELVARVRAHLRGRDAWRRTLQQRLSARTAVAQELGRIPVATSARECAREVCTAVDRVAPGMSSALVALTDEGEATLLVGTGSFRPEGGAGRLPRSLALRLHAGAADGPWVEQRTAQPVGALSIPLASTEVSAAAFIPLLAGDRAFGLLALADIRARADGDAAGCLSAGIDLAPIVAALLRPLLADAGRSEARRAALRRRLDSGGFRPVFQPIVELSRLRVVGFEALTRFEDRAEPARVFAEAAACGLGPELEAVTASAALAAGAALPEETWLSLNVSPAFVTDTDRMVRLLNGVQRPVVLELTEHDPIDDYASVLDAVAALDREPRLSVDDAGAGYACLHHVLQLRPAFVKLDRGWVTGIEDDPARQALVAGLGDFADRASGRLIAEGIETPAELEVLTDLGVPLGQGWLTGRPRDAAARP